MAESGKICTLQIDGKPVSVPEGTTILEAGRKLGIEIPTLCHHPALEPYGVCRVCIVELKRGRRVRVVTACNFPVEEDGLEVSTNSERIQRDRRVVIELLLARCFSSPVIREFAARFGVFDTDLEKTEGEECILCGLCVNVCRDLIGQAAIGFESRGADRKTAAPFGRAERGLHWVRRLRLCLPHRLYQDGRPSRRTNDRSMDEFDALLEVPQLRQSIWIGPPNRAFEEAGKRASSLIWKCARNAEPRVWERRYWDTRRLRRKCMRVEASGWWRTPVSCHSERSEESRSDFLSGSNPVRDSSLRSE